MSQPFASRYLTACEQKLAWMATLQLRWHVAYVFRAGAANANKLANEAVLFRVCHFRTSFTLQYSTRVVSMGLRAKGWREMGVDVVCGILVAHGSFHAT